MQEYWNNYVAVLKKFQNFEGRAGLAEFWMFVLVTLVIGLILGFISQGLSSLYSLFSLVPSLAVGARRLHDTGRSGWLQLLGLIPIIGWIILIYFFIQPAKHA